MTQGLSYVLLAGLAIALLAVCWTDVTTRRISNRLNGAIAAGALASWWVAGLSVEDILWRLGVVVACLVVGTALMLRNQMGGGDIKLLAALALWMRPVWFLHLITYTALAGGVLTLGFLIWKRIRGRPVKVPYGVAIAAGGWGVIAADWLPALAGKAHLVALGAG